ncbi:hypothetical protein L1987_26407 [Smallanthus sonchifolius]|uniref:Uncharacterized protein n=1 Tax=Smallanthus sonchifolius TaxID=185202 RepID=A0ACB9I9L2_9ASTR|nr:hypothetical protein L1987_26407 [Smallanthus sonchifolius]
MANARKEFGVLLALFTSNEKEMNTLGSIGLPHLKVSNELTVDWVLHEINLLEVDFLLKNTINDMIEKDMHSECISLLYPLLFCTKDDSNVSVPSVLNKDGDGITSTELSALNNSTSPCGSINGSVVPMKIIGDIQSLLLAVMCHITTICFSKKSFGADDLDDKERREKGCFVDAAIVFFRLQHLNPNVPVKTQEVDLLLNDGSKQISVTGWRKNATFAQRVNTSRRRCLLMTLDLAKTAAIQQEPGNINEEYVKKTSEETKPGKVQR